MKIIDTLKDRANNFTLLRLLAALGVLYGHSYVLSLGVKGGEDPISNFLISFWGESLGAVAVDLFFVTSGFLVTASYIQRQSLIAFIEARVLRIYPGLIVAVLFCVFVVGAVATNESLINYLSSPSVWSYLKHNITLVNGIQFDLPSVFVSNPYPVSVNGSLWTLPVEVWMYFWIAVLGSLSLLKGEKAFNAIFIICCLLYAQSLNNNFYIAGNPRNAQLTLLFFSGAFFYVNRSKIPLGIFGLITLCIAVYLTTGYQFSAFIKAVCFAYLVLLISLHPSVRLPSIDRWGDISYGLYIYAFPVQQTIAYLIPQLRPINMFLISTIITIIFAMLSWRFIEKPALQMKGKIQFRRNLDDAI
jgi:peptidoglycan/LPS O-acetylase OafA/YrhL